MAYDLVALQNYGLPAELAQQITELQGNFGESFGESFSRISLKGNRFSLKSGSVAEMISADKLDCVILADAPTDHCTYYAGKYDPTQEDVKPTAIWLQGQDAPLVVPPAALTKDATGRLGYSRAHRAVIVYVDPTTSQLKMEPVVFDIGSMSLYGDDMQLSDGTVAMSYSSFRRWCAKQGIPPCLVLTRVIFDMHQSVPTVRFIPGRNGSAPAILPQPLLGQVIEKAKSTEVHDLLKVTLIDGTEPSAQPAAAPQPQPQPQPQVAPASQPQVAPAPVQQTAAQPQVAPQPAPQPAPAPQSQVAPAPQAPVQQPAPQPQPQPVAPEPQVITSDDPAADDQLMKILAEAAAL